MDRPIWLRAAVSTHASVRRRLATCPAVKLTVRFNSRLREEATLSGARSELPAQFQLTPP